MYNLNANTGNASNNAPILNSTRINSNINDIFNNNINPILNPILQAFTNIASNSNARVN